MTQSGWKFIKNKMLYNKNVV